MNCTQNWLSDDPHSNTSSDSWIYQDMFKQQYYCLLIQLTLCIKQSQWYFVSTDELDHSFLLQDTEKRVGNGRHSAHLQSETQYSPNFNPESSAAFAPPTRTPCHISVTWTFAALVASREFFHEIFTSRVLPRECHLVHSPPFQRPSQFSSVSVW